MEQPNRMVTDFNEIVNILEHCSTLRLGINGIEDAPYVVPVLFAFTHLNSEIVFYGHSAKYGQKSGLLHMNSRVCLEADTLMSTMATDRGLIPYYESFIGYGTYELLREKEEKIIALKLLMARYGFPGYPLSQDDEVIMRTNVFRIVCTEFSGKHHLPHH